MMTLLTAALARAGWRAPQRVADAEAKSTSAALVSIEGLNPPQWSTRDYAAFAREGYMENAVVYRAVRMIAEGAASVPLLVYQGENELADHPLAVLLARPNDTIDPHV